MKLPGHIAQVAALLVVAILFAPARWGFAADSGADKAKRAAPIPDHPLFGFEGPDDLKAWLALRPGDPVADDPPATVALSDQHTAAGHHSLKITFDGGTWPAVTAALPEGETDWAAYTTLKADIAVERACVVGIRVMQDKSSRADSWEGSISRWMQTAFLKAGSNTLTGRIHPPNDYAIAKRFGKPVRLEITMYDPHAGESILVSNIRLTAEKLQAEAPSKAQFTVIPAQDSEEGQNARVSGIHELAKRYAPTWQAPQERTIEQVESDFKARYGQVKQAHPRALMAILRNGEKGWDPAHPDRVYDGWRDAYVNSHGPDGAIAPRSDLAGHAGVYEVFMRHRSPIMRVDLSMIPTASRILSAELVIVRRGDVIDDGEHNPRKIANLWVAEPCNRPWQESEVNAYRYAKDKYWKAIGGMAWDGEDPDFLPMYFVMGPSTGKVNVWNFTQLVRFHTDGKHPNFGFMPHGDGKDFIQYAFSREAERLKDRPAVLVMYEPAE